MRTTTKFFLLIILSSFFCSCKARDGVRSTRDLFDSVNRAGGAVEKVGKMGRKVFR